MKKLPNWLAAAVILVIIFGTIYAVVQQSQRNGANYPQIQLAEDTAASLNFGVKPATLVPGKVDISSSLAPFTIIYNLSGKVVAGSGYLNGSIPTIPIGVLSSSKNKTYNFVSWQPQDNVRVAVVSVAANNYYVASGRSLAEVEKNENKTFTLALLGGLASIVVLAAAFLVDQKKS